MSTELMRAEETQIAPATPMALIEVANQRGASVEQMAQLFDLQLRWESNEARKAFNAAMARFKADAPTVTKNVKKKAGPMELHYASLDAVCDAVIPALAKVGIRHSWTVRQENGQMTVSCVLSHEAGHAEETTMSGPYDTSGGKNPIQAIASAKTYLERYTLLAATGLAAAGTDDDGRAAGKKPVAAFAALPDYLDALGAAADGDELKRVFAEGYKKAQASGDTVAMADLIAAKDKRKGTL